MLPSSAGVNRNTAHPRFVELVLRKSEIRLMSQNNGAVVGGAAAERSNKCGLPSHARVALGGQLSSLATQRSHILYSIWHHHFTFTPWRTRCSSGRGWQKRLLTLPESPENASRPTNKN